MNESKTWLFGYTYYRYCQGTRDTYADGLRLLVFKYYTSKEDAVLYLKKLLKDAEIEYDSNSITNLTTLIM